MAQTTLYDRKGKSLGNVELADALFAAPVNAAVLHQVVTAQLAGRRTGTHDTKTRGEVRGGGAKPYRHSAIKIIDAFGIEAIKTRDLAVILGALKAHGRILVIAPGRDEKLELSARNLPTVEILLADSLNVVDLLKADIVLIEQPALARMEEVYA
jgi:large subunit ribosomal protein L4